MNYQITIVTGASSNHFNCLKNLLWSIQTFAPAANVVVYDLGLEEKEANQIPNIRKFDFSKYPSYFNIKENSGRMGFRPVAVQSAAKEFGGIVMWLDAGCLLRENPIEVFQFIKAHGVYCPKTHGTISNCLHPNARASLNVTDDLLGVQMRDAGISAFDTSNPSAMPLIDKWASVALDKNSTAPDGSSRKNHRQDAVYSVILHKSGLPLSGYRSHAIVMRQDLLSLEDVKRRYALFTTSKPR